MATPMTMFHEGNPADPIRKDIGDLSGVTIMSNQILVAIYVRPNVTKGGIIITDKTRDEDKYQGKVGLVLKTGPTAFKEEDGKWFGGETVQPGDWVFFRVSDGWSIDINGYPCRIMDDVLVRGKVTHPDLVW